MAGTRPSTTPARNGRDPRKCRKASALTGTVESLYLECQWENDEFLTQYESGRGGGTIPAKTLRDLSHLVTLPEAFILPDATLMAIR